MHFSEDDLREALKRKDPGENFTERVMARISQGEAASKASAPAKAKKSNGSFLAWWTLRPAWTFAVVTVLLLAFAFGGYKYSEYRHREEMRAAQEKQRQLQLEAEKNREEAERARDQAILALKIARSKLNHVLQQAQIPVEADKVRRQRL